MDGEICQANELEHYLNDVGLNEKCRRVNSITKILEM